MDVILWRSPSCQTLSNGFSTSRKMVAVCIPWLRLSLIWSISEQLSDFDGRRTARLLFCQLGIFGDVERLNVRILLRGRRKELLVYNFQVVDDFCQVSK